MCSVACAAALILPMAGASRAAEPTTESYGGREMLVHLPANLPPKGKRALVIVLHGGLGNARRISTMNAEGGLNLDVEAEKDGFIVAYLNGTPVTRFMGANMLGWNAGGGVVSLTPQAQRSPLPV